MSLDKSSKGIQSETGCMLFDLHASHSAIRVSGKDAFDYLQRSVSADLRPLQSANKELAPIQNSISSTLMTGKGELLASFNVLYWNSSWILISSNEHSEKLHTSLERFVIFEEVALEKFSDYSLYSLQGDKSSQLLSPIMSLAAANEDEDSDLQCGVLSSSFAYRNKRSIHGGLDLLVSEKDQKNFSAFIAANSIPTANANQIEQLRIEAGIPKNLVDYDETVLAAEVMSQENFSYTKGCFPGQEVVARIRTYGSLAKQLCLVKSSGQALEVNQSIFLGEKELGQITSSCCSITGGEFYALGILKCRDLLKDPSLKLGIRPQDSSLSWLNPLVV